MTPEAIKTDPERIPWATVILACALAMGALLVACWIKGLG